MKNVLGGVQRYDENSEWYRERRGHPKAVAGRPRQPNTPPHLLRISNSHVQNPDRRHF